MALARKHCAEPWFSHIRSGKKDIEGRLFRGFWTTVKPGQLLEIYTDDDPKRYCIVKVKAIHRRPSFSALVDEFGHRLLPGIALSRTQNGVNVYRQFFSEEDERRYGTIGLEIAVCMRSKF